MSRPWMPLYVADYLSDTCHLSNAEHGSYMLLIMHYWQRGGLPNDDVRLASIAKASLDQWQSMKPTIAEFFADGWRHGRIDEELEKSRIAYEKRALAGKKGGLSRKQCLSNASSNAEAMLNQPQPQSHTSSLRSDVEARKRAHRLPEDWVLPDDYREAARERGLSDDEATRQAARMLNWSRSSKAGAKLDWFRTWLNWIDDAPRQQRAPPPSNRNGLAALAVKLYGNVDGTTLQTKRADAPLLLLPIADRGERGTDYADDGGVSGKAFDGFG